MADESICLIPLFRCQVPVASPMLICAEALVRARSATSGSSRPFEALEEPVARGAF
jgi:hypothetical protein